MMAIETVRTLPTNRAAFAHVKILHVMEGAIEVETERDVRRLMPGSALALGAHQWCVIRPLPCARMWTIYTHEQFMREQMAWFLPDATRVRPGLHPHDWDGGPMVLVPGLSTLRRVEPLWRQMSVLGHGANTPEMAAVRTVELLAHWMSIVVPAFLAPEAESSRERTASAPVTGRLTALSAIGHVGRATQLLRERMEEPWTTTTLARAIAISRTHLTRQFVIGTGVAPMRYLTEVRLTEFSRLIEESDCSVTHAANAVGWVDPRTASSWFYRRYGITPSQYRLNPHPQTSATRAAWAVTGRRPGSSTPQLAV
ncbi:helix-turn-helix transcriptional regulator [Microlunatus sp. Y2014]|uniref:helix-turn-helix transcriptional regulator n=1 Tax=Microlunatus sp. Y2014 TaxID=3418488 RepID=UPI003DA6F622